MIFNYLFFFIFLLSNACWRLSGNTGLRIFSLLSFNFFCLFFFFYESLALLGSLIFTATLFLVSLEFPFGRKTRSLMAAGIFVGIFLLLKSFLPSSAYPSGASYILLLSVGFFLDIFRGQWPEKGSAFAHISALSFAPLLSAGPFVPLREILPQIKNPNPITEDSDKEAFLFFVLGMSKKFLADLLYAQFQLNFLLNQSQPSLYALLALPVYLYLDFSGYSDLARGLAKSFGLHIRANFLQPYGAKNFSEFWKRWHISLGEWFREYVFNTLVFQVAPKLRLSSKAMIVFTRIAVVTTMVCIGLWHELNVKFFVWGFVSGLLLAWPERIPFSQNKYLNRPILWVLIFFNQVLFFAPDLSRFIDWVTPAKFPNHELEVIKLLLLPTVLCAFHYLDGKTQKSPPLYSVWGLALILLFCLSFHIPGIPFIYAQF